MIVKKTTRIVFLILASTQIFSMCRLSAAESRIEDADLKVLVDTADKHWNTGGEELMAAVEDIRVCGTNLYPNIMEILARDPLSESDIRTVGILIEVVGPQLAPFQSDFRKELFHGKNPDFAAFALTKMGANAVPIFCEALTNQRPAVSRAALRFVYLFEESENAGSFVDGLIRCTGDDSGWARHSAIRLLGTIGKHGDKAVPHLMELLKNEGTDFITKMEAIRAIGRLGEHGKKGRPVLLKLSKDPDEHEKVREIARQLIKDIDNGNLKTYAEEKAAW